jgi:DNA-binding NtrC family response regulator
MSLRAGLRRQFGVSTIIAKSEPMLRIIRQVELAIPARTPLLLEGEPGTGKEHIARVIHHEMARFQSQDRDLLQDAFVPLDCARLLPIDLKRTLRRIFRAAGDDDPESALMPGMRPGTVYLENADAMPRDVQEFVVESVKELPPDSPLRIMAGTSADLETLSRTDAVREDFYYLLSPLRILLPPLRQRLEDFELLAQALLERLNVGAESQVEGFSEEAWKELREYNWPGNLDELDVVIKEAAANAKASVIGRDDLPFRFRMGRDAQSVGPRIEPLPRPLEPYLEQIEREQIEWALEQTKYNKKKTADLLGLTRTKLYRRMEALGFDTD